MKTKRATIAIFLREVGFYSRWNCVHFIFFNKSVSYICKHNSIQERKSVSTRWSEWTRKSVHRGKKNRVIVKRICIYLLRVESEISKIVFNTFVRIILFFFFFNAIVQSRCSRIQNIFLQSQRYSMTDSSDTVTQHSRAII